MAKFCRILKMFPQITLECCGLVRFCWILTMFPRIPPGCCGLARSHSVLVIFCLLLLWILLLLLFLASTPCPQCRHLIQEWKRDDFWSYCHLCHCDLGLSSFGTFCTHCCCRHTAGTWFGGLLFDNCHCLFLVFFKLFDGFYFSSVTMTPSMILLATDKFIEAIWSQLEE